MENYTRLTRYVSHNHDSDMLSTISPHEHVHIELIIENLYAIAQKGLTL